MDLVQQLETHSQLFRKGVNCRNPLTDSDQDVGTQNSNDTMHQYIKVGQIENQQPALINKIAHQ